VKYAIFKLRTRHSTHIEFKIFDEEVELSIHQRLTPSDSTDFKIKSTNLKEASKCLHIVFSKAWYVKWKNQSSAGRFVDSLAESPLSKSIMDSGKLSVAEWMFVHKCNTYTVPINARPGRTTDTFCRRCGDICENLAHVLNGCKFSESLTRSRHDAIANYIASQLRDLTEFEVTVNSRCRFTGDKRRVDLQIVSERNRRIFLVDIKCPYETDENIDRADSANLFHYADLAAKIRKVMPNHTVSCHTIAVGVPGTWPELSTKTLKDLKIRSDQVKVIAKHCILSNIRWSTAQWKHHRDGVLPDMEFLSRIESIPEFSIPDPLTHLELLDEAVPSDPDDSPSLNLVELFDM